jgi:hypothetical protein
LQAVIVLEETMSVFAAKHPFLTAGVFAVLASLVSDAAAQNAPPNFMGGAAWLGGGSFIEIPGSTPTPVRQDPRHRYVPNNTSEQPTYRIGDVSNPNLKPWVAAAMKKDNDEVLAGKYAYTARSSCAPGGVPGFMIFPAQPIHFVQTPKQVWILYQGNAEVRRIHLGVPHTQNPKSSFYGESVGRYEGDTLVIDTIGLNNKTVLDAYRTPHSDKLHVTERWRMVDGGKTLEVQILVEDPEAFNQPFQMMQRYERVPANWMEAICAENNGYFFQERIPTASAPDF